MIKQQDAQNAMFNFRVFCGLLIAAEALGIVAAFKYFTAKISANEAYLYQKYLIAKIDFIFHPSIDKSAVRDFISKVNSSEFFSALVTNLNEKIFVYTPIAIFFLMLTAVALIKYMQQKKQQKTGFSN